MSLRCFAAIVLALLAGQHTVATHGYSHVSPPGAAAVKMQSTDGDPLDAELHFCALCVAFNGSHGAPPVAHVGSFSSAPDALVVYFAVSPAPTFLFPAYLGRAPPSLPG